MSNDKKMSVEAFNAEYEKSKILDFKADIFNKALNTKITADGKVLNMQQKIALLTQLEAQKKGGIPKCSIPGLQASPDAKKGQETQSDNLKPSKHKKI